MRRFLIVALPALILLFTSAPSHAGWLIYHKPAFKGRVIDAETKEPIGGAVVVVTYEKSSIRLAPESVEITVDVRETLTDKDGNFHIPSFTTIIDPLSWEDMANFIIYKPGYGDFSWHRVYPPMRLDLTALEKFFSEETGTKGTVAWDYEEEEVTFGIVELPRLKTKEERIQNLPSIPGPGISSNKMKNLIRLSNEERVSLGLDPETFPSGD